MESTTQNPKTSDAELTYRAPSAADGAKVWELAQASRALDLNSPYAYVMWCDRFRDSSVVAEAGGRVVGFVCGFRPPDAPEALFVWQVAVSDDQRGRGVAGKMLRALVRRDASIRCVEATVTPSNAASQSLFRSLAKRLDCPCTETPHYDASLFPGPSHEPETLFRIGPFETPQPEM